MSELGLTLAPETMQPPAQPAVTAWLITTKQAAELMQVSQRTVFNWLADGVLESVKIGGVTRIWLDELKKLAIESTVRRTAE